jgi:glycosyltransferase involved in cell wall biosynthesis
MRILFIHDNAYVCETLAKGLTRRGHDTLVLGNSTNQYRLFPALALALEKRDIDVINSNEHTSWIVAEVVRRFIDPVHLLTLHGTDIRSLIQRKPGDLKRRLLTAALKSSDMVLATTHDLLKYSSVIEKEIFHLPLPIDTRIFNGGAPKNKELIGNPIVFSPTRLTDLKGADAIVRILERIVANYPSSHIYQVGWGNQSYLSRLLNKIPSKNLTIVGLIRRDQMPSWYVTSDIVIGQLGLGILSMVELEALSCGTPVVAYDKYYNYGCQTKDVESVWQATCSLLEDQSHRMRLIQKGSAIIREKHDLPLVAELYIKYLEKVI